MTSALCTEGKDVTTNPVPLQTVNTEKILPFMTGADTPTLHSLARQMASKHPVWMSSSSEFQEWLTDSSELKQPAAEINTVAELAYMLQCMTISDLQLQTAAAGTRNPFASHVHNERGINGSRVRIHTKISKALISAFQICRTNHLAEVKSLQTEPSLLMKVKDMNASRRRWHRAEVLQPDCDEVDDQQEAAALRTKRMTLTDDQWENTKTKMKQARFSQPDNVATFQLVLETGIEQFTGLGGTTNLQSQDCFLDSIAVMPDIDLNGCAIYDLLDSPEIWGSSISTASEMAAALTSVQPVAAPGPDAAGDITSMAPEAAAFYTALFDFAPMRPSTNRHVQAEYDDHHLLDDEVAAINDAATVGPAPIINHQNNLPVSTFSDGPFWKDMYFRPVSPNEVITATSSVLEGFCVQENVYQSCTSVHCFSSGEDTVLPSSVAFTAAVEDTQVGFDELFFLDLDSDTSFSEGSVKNDATCFIPTSITLQKESSDKPTLSDSKSPIVSPSCELTKQSDLENNGEPTFLHHEDSDISSPDSPATLPYTI